MLWAWMSIAELFGSSFFEFDFAGLCFAGLGRPISLLLIRHPAGTQAWIHFVLTPPFGHSSMGHA